MKKLIMPFLLLMFWVSFTPCKAQDDNLEESWKSLASVRDDYAIWCMYFKDEKNGWAGGPGTIIHTTDGGMTWEKQKTGFGRRILCIYFKNLRDGFAAGESDSYMETHDGGVTWTDRSSVFSGCKFRKIFFVNDQTGYMLSESGVYRTTDGGKAWANIGPKKPEDFGWESYNGLTARDAKHLILVGNKEMMFMSDDGGTTWVANKKEFFSGERRNFYGIAFTDANNGWITLERSQSPDVDCLVTKDGGATWTPGNVFGNHTLKDFNFSGKTGWGMPTNSDHNMYVTYDGGATWKQQTVTKDYKVKCAYCISPKASYVGLHGVSDLFTVYVPKGN
jgi:photosystem II stability/assembly factor-like uncharacterized protein